jgi:phosphate starvation-inducible PhoH-like protein
MSKRRNRHRESRYYQDNTEPTIKEKFHEERHRPPLRALTDAQAHYIAAVLTKDQVVSMGCAGTGKTYIAATIAADMLRDNKVKKIILTRPNVEAGRSLGFFKGTMEEKIAPWVVPFTEVIQQRLGSEPYEIYQKRGQIEIVPFEVMRGRSFNNAFVILDEAQNTTIPEMKMFLTRIGENSKVIINGDIRQSDINEQSGLAKIVYMIKRHMLNIPVIEFTEDDIVRSDICAQWIKAFHKEGL